VPTFPRNGGFPESHFKTKPTIPQPLLNDWQPKSDPCNSRGLTERKSAENPRLIMPNALLKYKIFYYKIQIKFSNNFDPKSSNTIGN
jgi:hypothetical protein